MPRIRTIKPEFWGDEKLAPCDALTRLVFLGLLSMSDDTGRVVDSIRAIDGFIFPMTDDTAGPSLVVLQQIQRIARGQTESGQQIIQIVNWNKHQKIDKPNLAAALPALSTKRRRKIGDPSARTTPKFADTSTLHTNDLRPTTNDQRPTTTRGKKPRGASEVVDGDFEAAWTAYPQRGGGNSKAAAQRKWMALRIADVPAADLLGAVQRYARFATATGKVGTELVMQASRFFGPDESWREQWTLPVVAPKPGEQTVVRPANAADRAAEQGRFDQEQERRARIDKAYVAARAVVVREWAMQQPTETLAAIEAKVAVIFGGMTGPMAAEIRKGAVDAECAKRAGFPDVDAWVIIENTKRRGAQASA